jgi:phosphoserine phosphatase
MISTSRQPVVAADLDGTLRRHSLFADVMIEAAAQNIIDTPRRINIYGCRIEEWLGVLSFAIAGRPIGIFDSSLAAVAPLNEQRTFGFTKPLIDAALSAGLGFAIISRSPEIWVKRYATSIGLDPSLAWGSELEIHRGMFTGKIVPLDKDVAMARLEAAGYSAAIGMGDTAQDTPIINAALQNGGHGVAVGFEDYTGDAVHTYVHGQGYRPSGVIFVNETVDRTLELCHGPLGNPRGLGAFACSAEEIDARHFIAALGLE